jgi:uncharacterized membrane protein (UPF0127 family)
VRIVHESGRTLAADAAVAEGLLQQARGVAFRRSFPGEALVFPFGDQRKRGLHMVFVPFPLDACWLCDGVVQATATLRPWVGYGRALCDTAVEFPAGTLDCVEAGDRLRLETQ